MLIDSETSPSPDKNELQLSQEDSLIREKESDTGEAKDANDATIDKGNNLNIMPTMQKVVEEQEEEDAESAQSKSRLNVV